MPTMTPDVFNAFVHITTDDGVHHEFGPGDPIPDWARPYIGEHVIHKGGLYEEDEPAEAVAAMAARFDEPELVAQAPGYTAFVEQDQDGTGPDVPQPPPTSGPGSGQQAWFRYAQAVGETEPTSSWTRQDIIDLLIRRGHISD
jgi:hypothetical protein